MALKITKSLLKALGAEQSLHQKGAYNLRVGCCSLHFVDNTKHHGYWNMACIFEGCSHLYHSVINLEDCFVVLAKESMAFGKKEAKSAVRLALGFTV